MGAAGALLNRLAQARVGRDAVDLDGLLRMVEAAPFGAGFWLTAMLLSTLLPTALHIGFALYGLVLPVHVERRKQHRTTLEAAHANGTTLSKRQRHTIARYLVLNHGLVTVAMTALLVVVLVGATVQIASLFETAPLLSVARHAIATVGG
ncbi:MAG: hypothetical protein AAF624_17990 [Bacteroidota bacterium]